MHSMQLLLWRHASLKHDGVLLLLRLLLIILLLLLLWVKRLWLWLLLWELWRHQVRLCSVCIRGPAL
mgnify:CR=1 FL=1